MPDLAVAIERVAFRMFGRNMEGYEFDPGTVHLAWVGDEQLQAFWIEQAQAVIDDYMTELGTAEPVPVPAVDVAHERGSE